MCKAMEDMRKEAESRKANEIVIKLIELGNMLYAEIAQVTGLDVLDVEKLAKNKV